MPNSGRQCAPTAPFKTYFLIFVINQSLTFWPGHNFEVTNKNLFEPVQYACFNLVDIANIRLSTTTEEGKNRMEVKFKLNIFGVELSSATNQRN